jgi:hypothetical protein
VEAVTGAAFLILAACELFTGGANLAVRPPDFNPGILGYDLLHRSGILGIYFYHCVLICTLLCIVLIDVDRMPQPIATLAAPVALFGAAAAAAFPQLSPVPIWPDLSGHGSFFALAQSIAGMALGGLLGRAYFGSAASGPSLVLVLAGCFLGWQAVAATSVLGVAFRFVGTLVRAPAPESFFFAAAAFCHLLLWRRFAQYTVLPGPETPAHIWGVWALFGAFSIAAARLFPHSSSNEPN